MVFIYLLKCQINLPHSKVPKKFFSVVSHSPNHGVSDEFVYEGYPDQESPASHVVTTEPRPQYPEEEEWEEQQAIGAEDYELEETESEISGSDTDQVRPNVFVATIWDVYVQ